MEQDYYFPAEWERQEGVQLTWPHETTDWHDILEEAERCFVQMAKEIAGREALYIVAPDVTRVRRRLEGALSVEEMDNVSFFACPTNDTWARDHAFLSLLEKGTRRRKLLDFRFNGWGMKFAANEDNQINRRLYQKRLLLGDYVNCLDFVLEGGAIESDGKGTLLTTSCCLLAPNRNEPLRREEIARRLRTEFYASRVLWLEHGHLEGDDTDGHVDTLVRFAPNDTLVYCKEESQADAHYTELKAMEEELTSFRTLEGKPYKLVALPLPDAMYDEEGMRLPATYANYLPINGAVLVPVYSQPEKDERAKAVLQSVFPDREIIGVECSVLVRQHGSLHCSTMQYPL